MCTPKFSCVHSSHDLCARTHAQLRGREHWLEEIIDFFNVYIVLASNS